MTAHAPFNVTQNINKLANAASELGYEIVDIDSFLGLVETHAVQQREALAALLINVEQMANANSDATDLAQSLRTTSQQAQQDVSASVSLVRTVSDRTKEMAVWVTSIQDRSTTVGQTLRAVQTNSAQIAKISVQINSLAINAKIEAARAGDAGRGFAVVADAINDLSKKTSTAARQIADNIESLTGWITQLGREAIDVADIAYKVLEDSVQTDKALTQMKETIEQEHRQTQRISIQIERVKSAMDVLQPTMREIDTTVRESSSGVARMHARMANLIGGSELIVQLSAGLGGASPDAPFIAKVQQTATQISQALEAAVTGGHVTLAELFDRSYTPISDTNPVQLVTLATNFLDDFLPRFQEPVLPFDASVVFCAAVDKNGYLPTHNKKFSKPQGTDVVWNTAHARNRRIFDDRVGLKAGRSTAPFLLQVYRRDMGGKEFRVMKGLSAPIKVNGRHWGGLVRLFILKKRRTS